MELNITDNYSFQDYLQDMEIIPKNEDLPLSQYPVYDEDFGYYTMYRCACHAHDVTPEAPLWR